MVCLVSLGIRFWYDNIVEDEDAELADWLAGRTKTNQEEIKNPHFIGHPLETSGTAKYAAGGTSTGYTCG